MCFALGLIPAHAGKTWPSPTVLKSSWAHPRSRGENLIGVAADLAAQGSSPLTRGKRTQLEVGDTVVRLIPAHAGKTSGVTVTARPGLAHPRSRGENTF